MTQGYFQGLQDSKVYERGVFLEPGGTYKLELKKTIVKQTRASGDGFIAEFKVLESNNPKNPAGSDASWFQGLKDKDVAFGAIKEFLYALMGYDVKDKASREKAKAELDPVIEKLVNEAISQNVLAGKTISCQTSSKLTKNKVNFTVHTWSPNK